MRVTDVDVVETGRGARISATFVWNGRGDDRDSVYFLYRDHGVSDVLTPGDALLAAALVPSVIFGHDVVVDAPVSRKLLDATPAIVDYFVSRVRKWHAIGVEAPAVDRSNLAPGEIASAFSGGVDSSYAALRPREAPLTMLITMLGLDYAELLPELEPLIARLSRAADELGKRHLVVESNAYVLGLERLPWSGPRGIATLGSLVIAQALGIGSVVRRMHVPSAGTHVAFEGTHPDLDRLWSTEALEIVHEPDATRLEKVRAIAEVPALVETLHVCHRPRERAGNCGRCDKCVGTALGLQLVGGIERCATLDAVSPSQVRSIDIDADWVPFFKDLHRHANDVTMRRAIAFALKKTRLRRPLRPLGRALRQIGFRRTRGRRPI